MAERSRMARLALLTALALTACASAAPTPDGRPVAHAFGGVARLALETARDDLLVPKAHTGGGLGFALAHASVVGEGALRTDLGIGARYLRGQYGAQALIFDHGLRVRYALDLGGAWHVAVGPAFGWETDLAYYESWDDAHAYWLTDRWLGVTVGAWHRLGPCWRLDLAAELMAVAIESRRPEPPDHKQDGLDDLGFYFAEPQRYRRFAWLADTQRARLAADLWRTPGDGRLPSGWALGLEARLVHAGYPEPLTILELALRFTWMWGFP